MQNKRSACVARAKNSDDSCHPLTGRFIFSTKNFCSVLSSVQPHNAAQDRRKKRKKTQTSHRGVNADAHARQTHAKRTPGDVNCCWLVFLQQDELADTVFVGFRGARILSHGEKRPAPQRRSISVIKVETTRRPPSARACVSVTWQQCRCRETDTASQ